MAMLFSVTPAMAADTINTSEYLDTDNDIQVDTIRWTMDETVTSCTYDAADWSVDTATSMNISITGVTCAGSDSELNIQVSADADETGASTDPVISYTNNAGNIQLNSGPMTGKASVTAIDSASPKVTETIMHDDSAPLGVPDRLQVDWSEEMEPVDLSTAANTPVFELYSIFAGGTTCTVTDISTGSPQSTFDLPISCSGIATDGSAMLVTFSTGGSEILIDDAGNSNIGNSIGLTPTDTISPVVVAYSYLDQDVNGQVDAIQVNISETLNYSNSKISASDLSIDDVGDFTGISLPNDTIDYIDSFTNTAVIPITESSAVSTHDESGAFSMSANEPGTCSGGSVLEDDDGNQSALCEIFSSVGGAVLDQAAPAVVSTTPQDGAPSASPSLSAVNVQFSEEMLTGLASDAVVVTEEGSAFGIDTLTWSDSVDSLDISFTNSLSPETSYLVTLNSVDPEGGGGKLPGGGDGFDIGSYSMSAFEDSGGINYISAPSYGTSSRPAPLNGSTEPYTFEFTTGAAGAGPGGGGDSCSGIPGEVCIPGTGSVPVEETACEVISPNGGGELTQENEHTVTWNTSGDIDNINLLYSINNGETWRRVQSGLENDGEYEWSVPDVNTGEAKVRIDCRDAGGAVLFSDHSDEVFTIGDPSDPTEEESEVPSEEPVDIDVQPGDLIKLPNDGDPTTYGDSSVYVIGTDGERHPFPNETVYRSWYPDFDNINVINQDKMAAIELGDPILVRPGTHWVKIQSNPKVFYVEPGSSILRHIADEEVAQRLGGEGWKENVIDIPVTCFDCYEQGDPITLESLDNSWPNGALVKSPDDNAIHYIDDGYLRTFDSQQAMEANNFQERFVEVNEESSWMDLPTGFFITDYEERLFLDVMTP
jgi:hypothetical protein